MSGPTADPNFSWPVSHAEFDAAIKSLWTYVRAQQVVIKKQGAKFVSVQDQINAASAALTDLSTKVNAEDSALKAAIVAIQAWIAGQAPAVDVSGLEAVVTSLGAANDALAADVNAAAALVPVAPPVVPPAA